MGILIYVKISFLGNHIGCLFYFLEKMGYFSVLLRRAKARTLWVQIPSSIKKRTLMKAFYFYGGKDGILVRCRYRALVRQSKSINDGRTYGFSSHQAKKEHPKGCSFFWRKRWDSNPCAENSTTAFRVRLVMTTSILFRVPLYYTQKNVICK